MCLFSSLSAFAQSGIAFNFGIDGNLLANTPGPVFVNTDDWLDGSGGTGIGVLNPDGTPRNTETTFHLIDLSGGVDPGVFPTGIGLLTNPDRYTWIVGTVPYRDNIENALVHFFLDDQGDLWMAGAGDRQSTNGDTYFDFEFLQNALYVNADSTFTSEGPDSGRTVGDFMITINLVTGGGPTALYAYVWGPDGMGGFTYTEYTPASGSFFAAANIDSQVVVPFGAFSSTTYQFAQFGEGAINLSNLIWRSDNCMQTGTLFIHTRSSILITANLRDFIEPIQFAICADETDPVIFFCPPETWVAADADISPGVLGWPTASDNCGVLPTLSFRDEFIADPDTLHDTMQRHWRAEDSCGNADSCLQVIHIAKTATGVGGDTGLPQFALLPAYPNPFRHSAVIEFHLDALEKISLCVFDVSGNRVRVLRDGTAAAGVYREAWDGRDESGRPVAGGIYFVRLAAGTRTLTRKMVLLQ